MIPAAIPENELERLISLNEYGILDSLPEQEYDDITRIAAQVCGTSMSFVTIIDHNRQWFKSHFGSKLTETAREFSFCAHTIHNRQDEALIIENVQEDERFANNPVNEHGPNVKFYAGVPLINKDGFALGALCVADTKPNHLDKEQLETVQALGRQVIRLFELKRTVNRLSEKQIELAGAYEDLDKFTTIASHDLRSPLNNIISLTTLLNEMYEGAFDEEGREYMNYLKESAYQLSHMVTGILEYSKSSTIIVDNKENIEISELYSDVSKLLAPPENVDIVFDRAPKVIYSSRIAVKQILLNLINNAIKYSNKDKGIIELKTDVFPDHFTITITDNGPGVTDTEKDKMFNLFERLKYNTGYKEGYGIGLTIVKRLVEKLSGNIIVTSTLGEGMTLVVSIPKKI